MKRPTPVTVFAVLNLVFGIGGAICVPVLAAFFILGCSPAGKEEAASSMLEGHLYLMGALIYAIVTSGVLIASGVGLWNLRPWGRKLSIGFAPFHFILLFIGCVMEYFMYTEPTQESASRLGTTFPFVVDVIGSGLELAYPVLLLVFMFTPTVRAAFYPPAPPPLPEG